MIERVAAIPRPLCKTLTWDRGREMFLHEQVTNATGLDIFFADPHAPWQRPSNENTNGLLRQYFPKHSDLSIHTAADLQRIARELNDRPRLVLDDRSPAEIMRGLISTAKTA